MSLTTTGLVRMPGRAAIAVVSMLLFSGAAHAVSDESDRIIGLLALPQLFGDWSCDISIRRQPLVLFERADSTVPIGEARVDTPPKMAAEGGCDWLEVVVHLAGADDAVRPLPTREYGYEEAGAVVFARRGNRFRIALEGAAAWVEPLAGAEFHPMEKLVTENISYLAGAWDGMVCAAPGQSGTCRKTDAGVGPEPGVTVLGHRNVGGRLWFQIEVPSRETCGEPAPAIPRTRGWIRGHDNNGEPAIWFYSRGC